MKVFLLTLMLLVPASAHAERLPLKSYTVADGLPNNVINKIVRDSRGFLWFCTAEGLARFDGYTFTSFGVDHGLPHTMVNDFLETRNGELWVATDGGLVLFNPKGEPAPFRGFANNSQSQVSMFTVLVPETEDRAARAANVLFEDRKGTIWCGTMRYLYRLERTNGRLKLMPVDLGPRELFVLDMLEDRNGVLWIGSNIGLFRQRPDGQFDHYTKRDGLPDEMIHDLLVDHQGQLWAATRLGGFFRLVDAARNSSIVTEVHDKRRGLPTDWIFQLFETSNRRFWLATNFGLIEFFPDAAKQEEKFHTYTRRSGLTYHEITTLNEDVNGNLWLGTNVTGTMKLERNGFLTYDEPDGIATVNAIFGDQANGVCFRAFTVANYEDSDSSLKYEQQLGRYDDRGFQWFMPTALSKKGWVFEYVTLQTRSGEWWIGTGDGLYRFSAAQNFTQLKSARPLSIYSTADGLASQQVYRLFEDSTGAIWITTISPNGLARWQAPSAKLEPLENSPNLPPSKNELALAFGEDSFRNIWIGFSGGLARFRSGSFQFFTTKDGLPPGGIVQIYLDRSGRLWLGSSRSGLIRVDNPAAERPVFKTYTTVDGLSSNATGVIVEDLLGRMYVGTGRGLDQLDPETGHVKHFTTADGLASGSLTAAFRDRNGALWFGTQKGMSRFEPSAYESSVAPPILISGVHVSGSSQKISALGEEQISLSDLTASQNQVQIDFVGLSFAVGDVLRYQYKLEGATDWSMPAEQRTVNFASLSPGRYRFFVRALNSDGAVSSQPAIVTFRILPPLWQRWWFLALALMAVMLGVYTLYRYRVSRLLELERVRTRIASDLHDDIGSNLSLIAGLSEMLRQQARHLDGQIAERLSIIANASRQSVEAMGDIVWAVNPKRDNVIDLAHRMRRFANDSLSSRNIDFDFNTPSQNVKINADARREVFLIFKEAINNIARHSRSETAKASLQINLGQLVLEVSDDGQGFEQTNLEHGHGLESMRQRAKKLGGKIEVKSLPGSGTKIILTAPIDTRV